MRSNFSRVLIASVAALVTACAGAPRPEARLSSSEGAIRGAQEAGAEQVPQATLELTLAREQRARAVELVNRGDNHRADMVLARAEADAELAVALAHSATAKAEADQAARAVVDIQNRGAR